MWEWGREWLCRACRVDWNVFTRTASQKRRKCSRARSTSRRGKWHRQVMPLPLSRAVKEGKEKNPPAPPLKRKAKKTTTTTLRVRAREEEFADRLFLEFWAKYTKECPRKVGKKKCRAKYALLMRNAKDSTALHAAILARLNARPCRPVECPLFAAKEGGAA